MNNLLVWGAVADVLAPILGICLLVVSIFLILLVLIQRGKGGGLAGAFGGAGGSSAFGTRAGDTFTRITIYVAAIWVLLIMFLIKTVQPRAEQPQPPAEIQSPAAPAAPTGEVPAEPGS